MEAELLRIVEDRLERSGRANDAWAMLVLAACEGQESLDAVLGGKARRATSKSAPKVKRGKQEPPGAYIRSVTVEGFRGVGPRKTLELTPGPGLTLIIGRNGSGKSSFAEALEILLTGSNWRWLHRSVVWKEGWRNLHQPSPVEVAADFAVEGAKGSTTITRSWGPHDELDGSKLMVDMAARKDADFSDIGWDHALEAYRPFLSYNELGSMFDEGPTKLHDRLSKILGLGELEHAEQLLKQGRLALEARSSASKKQAPALLADIQSVDDERAKRAAAALSGRKPDLSKVRAVLEGDDTADAGQDSLATLRAIASLEVPSTAEAVRLATQLRELVDRATSLTTTDARRMGDLVTILRQAIAFHDRHGDGNCPVCGNPDALDKKWHKVAAVKLEDLEARNSEWQDIERETQRALAEVDRFLVRPPAILRTAAEAGVDVVGVPAAWARLLTKPDSADLNALADHLQEAAFALDDEATEVRLNAQAELERRQDLWRPISLRLAAWLAQAEEAAGDEGAVSDLKAAEKWLRDASADIRAERFEPIAAEAIKNWNELRQQSSVEVGRIALEGTGARRKVAVDVEIDGVEGAALGVMSQGELHAIALGMFLPRATLPESPFRFVVIDDPVQSMDPARVDGLAQVLARTAKTRQVIVFTHDDRLPESTRRLGIDATIVEVTRHEDSVIDLRESLDPVSRNLDDAGALVKTKSLPMELAQEVVPAFCRSAIEAAAIEVVRRRRIGRGESHYAVEQLLEGAKKTNELLSLALWDEAGRGGDVMKNVSQRWGEDVGDALGIAVRGAHAGYRGSLDVLVRDTRRLCTKVAELPA